MILNTWLNKIGLSTWLWGRWIIAVTTYDFKSLLNRRTAKWIYLLIAQRLVSLRRAAWHNFALKLDLKKLREGQFLYSCFRGAYQLACCRLSVALRHDQRTSSVLCREQTTISDTALHAKPGWLCKVNNPGLKFLYLVQINLRMSSSFKFPFSSIATKWLNIWSSKKNCITSFIATLVRGWFLARF